MISLISRVDLDGSGASGAEIEPRRVFLGSISAPEAPDSLISRNLYDFIEV